MSEPHNAYCFASYEASKPYESNLNNNSDMKNSEATNQPMLPELSTCVADNNDELSKDSIDRSICSALSRLYEFGWP